MNRGTHVADPLQKFSPALSQAEFRVDLLYFILFTCPKNKWKSFSRKKGYINRIETWNLIHAFYFQFSFPSPSRLVLSSLDEDEKETFHENETDGMDWILMMRRSWWRRGRKGSWLRFTSILGDATQQLLHMYKQICIYSIFNLTKSTKISVKNKRNVSENRLGFENDYCCTRSREKERKREERVIFFCFPSFLEGFGMADKLTCLHYVSYLYGVWHYTYIFPLYEYMWKYILGPWASLTDCGGISSLSFLPIFSRLEAMTMYVYVQFPYFQQNVNKICVRLQKGKKIDISPFQTRS